MNTCILRELLEEETSLRLKRRINCYDNDLILFCESRGSYILNSISEYRIIGGRSAKPIKTFSLVDHLAMTRRDAQVLRDVLHDSGCLFCLLPCNGSTMLIFNGLFRSCGLGIALVYDVDPRKAGYADSKGMFYGLSDFRYFGESSESNDYSLPEELDDEVFGFSESIFDAVRSLRQVVGGDDLHTARSDLLSVYSMILAASDLSGGAFELMRFDVTDWGTINKDSLASFLLCAFSLCRRLSVTRSGALEVIQRDSGVVTLGFSFEIYGCEEIDEVSMSCIRTCEAMADRLEAPLSIDVTGRAFKLEFTPLRADPSLSGLKAGVRFKLN